MKKKMADIEKIKKEIVKKMMAIKPEKIVIFGSYAHGNPEEDSDLDLYVVTNDNFMPKNYREKSEVYLKVSRVIRDMRKKIPIDLIAHTRKMHKKFIELDSMFAREIMNEGVIIYEH